MNKLQEDSTRKAQDLLTAYADFVDRRTLLELNQRDMEAKIITPEIQKQLDDVRTELAPAFSAIDEQLEALREQIKAAVTAGMASASTDRFQAVYSKPRVTWDSKALDGYAVAHPEINAFRKEGAPSVSIRTR